MTISNLGVGNILKACLRLWPQSFCQGGDWKGERKLRSQLTKTLFKNLSYFRIAVQTTTSNENLGTFSLEPDPQMHDVQS
jgi:hypothetical protein